MSLASAVANWSQRITVQAYVSGRPVQPTQGWAESGYDSISAACEVTLASYPDWLQFNQEIVLLLGYEGFTEAVFSGYIEDAGRQYWPFTSVIRGAGWMKLTQLQYPDALTYTSQLDGDIITDLLSKSGVPRYTVASDGVTLGQVQDVVLNAAQAPSDLIGNIDQVWSYATFDMPDGSVRRQKISAIPAQTGGYAFTQGSGTSGNILSITRPQTVRGVHNVVHVLGLAQTTFQADVTRRSDSPFVRRDIAYEVRSDLIETTPIAQSIAAVWMPRVNRLLEQVTVKTVGDPRIRPGATATVTASQVNLSAEPFWIKHVRHEFNENSYLTTTLLEGGRGEAGWETNVPPVAVFNYRITRETYEVASVQTDMYTVNCDGSASYDPDGDSTLITFAWTDSAGGSGSGSPYYATAFTAAQMAGGPTITLTVTDSQGFTDTLVQTLTLTNDPILTRELYVAAGLRAESTPDGGHTWNTWTPGAGNVISTPEIGAIDFGLFGLSTGALYKTTDQLATAPTLLHTFPSQVNAIWVNEINSARITVGLQSGALYQTNDGGTTWVLLSTRPDPVLHVIEYAQSFGSIRIARGDSIEITDNNGAGWRTLVTWSGGTARRQALSFMGNANSATDGGGSAPVKDDGGTAYTFPVLTPAVTDVRALTHHIRDAVLYAVDLDGTTARSFATTSGSTTFVVAGTIASAGQPNRMIRDGDSWLELYLACDNGLYKSFDGANTWVRLRDYSAGGGLQGNQVGYGSAPWTKVTPLTVNSTAGDGVCYHVGADTVNLVPLDTEPDGWRNETYDDSGWTASQAGTVVGWPANPSGASWITYNSSASINGDVWLFRQKFDIGSGNISQATIKATTENMGLLWINNVLIGQQFPPTYSETSPRAVVTYTIDPRILIAGGTNVLACEIQNARTGGAGSTDLVFQLQVS